MEILESPYKWLPQRVLQPKGIVIHAMSEFIHHDALDYFDTIEKEDYPEWIPAMDYIHLTGLSAHAFITVDGKVQLGQDSNKCAYHAGTSYDKKSGIKNLNSHYLGIEILMPGNNLYGEFIDRMENDNWVGKDQMYAVSYITAKWLKEFNLSFDRVVGHNDVSGKDVRPNNPKYDPGNMFPWETFKNQVSFTLGNFFV